MTVTNVVSHSFGVVALRRSGAGYAEYISNLVLAQTRLPVTQTRQYSTVEANQEAVDLRIMESSLRQEDIDDLAQGSEVGTAILPMTPGLPQGAPIEVTFELNQQGRLVITGMDLAVGGKSVTATIETDRALSKQDIDKAIARSRGVTVS
jgi:molecular chaperone DnaK